MEQSDIANEKYSKNKHFTSTIYLLLRCSTEKPTQLNIKTTHPIPLTFFSNFLSFDSHLFIYFVFCISSDNISTHRRCSVKKRVLRNFAKFTGKHLCQSLFFNKVAGTVAQVFSCKFCEISKNKFFTEHLRTTTSATNGTVSHVAFVYRPQVGIYYSVKLLFSYSPQVFFKSYGQEVHLATL